MIPEQKMKYHDNETGETFSSLREYVNHLEKKKEVVDGLEEKRKEQKKGIFGKIFGGLKMAKKEEDKKETPKDVPEMPVPKPPAGMEAKTNEVEILDKKINSLTDAMVNMTDVVKKLAANQAPAPAPEESVEVSEPETVIVEQPVDDSEPEVIPLPDNINDEMVKVTLLVSAKQAGELLNQAVTKKYILKDIAIVRVSE